MTDYGKGLLSFLLWTAVFSLSYSQAPLYYSNQHQYFLHGLAEGGYGLLSEDWLANTADPTPIFSTLVALTYQHLHEAAFYVYYALLLGLYLWAMWTVFIVLTPGEPTRLGQLCFLTLFLFTHAAIVRLASVYLSGVDYPYYLQTGVAGQYVLGPVLQPSAFGVLLLVSVAVFLRDRPFLAVTCACLAAGLHATYLLTAAWLTAAYMILLYHQGRGRSAVLLGALALVWVLPGIVYGLRTFAPSSPEVFADAQRILVNIRIPHHALIARWFDTIALVQILWVVAAIILVRGSPLFWIMLIVAAFSVVLTLVQLVTGSETLALLFPWRSSAILVPLATTIFLTRFVGWLAPWLGRRSPGQARALRGVCGAVLGILVAGGIAINVFGLGYRMDAGELPLLNYVQQHKSSGDVYLLPIQVPKLGAGPRGAFSTTFTPPPRQGKDVHLIAVDLQRFRLATGAPLFVDFKSVPYKDVEVAEWHRRLLQGAKLYEQPDWDTEEIQAELARMGITHVITTATRELRSAALEQVYGDERYRVYRVLAQARKSAS